MSRYILCHWPKREQQFLIVFASVPTQLMEKELSKLTIDDQNNEAQLLNDIVFKASSHDINVQLEGIKEVKNAVSRDLNPPIDYLVALGIIPILVNCLKKENEELALEAISTLATIASGSSEWAEKVVATKAVPELVQLLSSPNESLREWVVRILGHMIDAGSKSANECFKQRVVDHVMKSLTPVASSSFVECVFQFVENSCNIRQNTDWSESLEKLLPIVSFLLMREDLDILFHSIKIILWLVEAEHIDLIIESGIMRQLMPLLSHDNDKLKALTVKVFGNIVVGTDEQAQAVLDNGLLKYFPGFLFSSNDKFVTNALWLLSNVAAGNQEQIQAVIDAGLIPSIINAMDKGSDEIRREAAWTVCNIGLNGSTGQIKFLVDNGVITPLCSHLTSRHSMIPLLVLETMEKIIKSSDDRQTAVVEDIKKCGGLASVKLLMEHDNGQIHNRASEVINEFFPSEGEEKTSEEPMNFEENC